MHPATERIIKLPVAEKLQILEELWDDLSTLNDCPVPGWVIEEASRRAAELKSDPSLAITDEEFWRRVDASLKNG